MKEWLLETPVILTFFVRTETLSRTFDVIRKVRPKALFLAGDGPRNDGDKAKIGKCHKILENVDWDCQVHRYYAETNRGILQNGDEAIRKAFQLYDKLIFLEDDMLCSESFFWFCQEMLERYKDDPRVQLVCGQNLEGVSEEMESDYFFARRISSGCVGFWREKYEVLDFSYPVFEDTHLIKSIEGDIPKKIKQWGRYLERAKRDREDYRLDSLPKSTEVALTLNFYLNHCMSIIPKRNMAVSIGLSEDSAHAPDRLEKLPKGIRRLFELPVYELEFPLKHPKYVACDTIYEEKWCRIQGAGYPWVGLWRLIARFLLEIRYVGLINAFGTSVKKMKRRFHKGSDING